jgi:hypothetical protein
VGDIADICNNYQLHVQVSHVFKTPSVLHDFWLMPRLNSDLSALKYFICVNEYVFQPFKGIKKYLNINQIESTSSPLFFTALASFF